MYILQLCAHQSVVNMQSANEPEMATNVNVKMAMRKSQKAQEFAKVYTPTHKHTHTYTLMHTNQNACTHTAKVIKIISTK